MRLDPELTKGIYYGLLAGVAVLVLVLPPKPQPMAVAPSTTSRIEAVTLEDIRVLARQLFTQPEILAVVGPA